MSLRRVFEPLLINQLKIPNRIARSAHGTSLALHGAISDQLIAYHAARAKGGVGLTILEAAAVHPSTITSFANLDDSVIDGYRRLMAQVRPHGMKVFQQLWHGGHIYPVFDRSVPWGVSSTPNPSTGIVPNPVGLAEIQTLVAAYAAAARRCREGGLDGIEVHAAHGYLVMQFLNPLTNLRTDSYGGSLDNRMRFLREVMVAVRHAVGADFPLGLRIGEGMGVGGIAPAEMVLILERLHEDRLIDFVNATQGDYWDISGIMGAMDRPTGYQLPSSGQITSAFRKVPRMVIGRIRTLEEAEQILREGLADVVHLTRAHIADPDLVRKTRAGHPEQVRPCIACNQGCYHAVASGWPIGCAVNPAAGREIDLAEDLLVPSSTPRKVLIIGGGPAGMEAARVAAMRGHTVTLVEAAPGLGGQALRARQTPKLQTLGDIIQWLESEIGRLGVDIRTNTYLEAEEALAFGADYIVVATGSLPRGNAVQYTNSSQAVPGGLQAHVISPIDLLERPGRNVGTSAVVFDEVGHYEGLAVAEHLLEMGLAVTFVTPLPRVAPLVDHDTRVLPALRRFARIGTFQLFTNARLDDIREGSCLISPAYQPDAQEIAADTVLFLNAKAPLRGIYDELVGRGLQQGENIVLVGDALAPRDIQYAIAEGHRLTRAML
ncbi:FAD-dependent oxidoreductase [Novosphingobium sp. PASSN1]|uniref:oxidoreductase n=1 Tax=Novosphingobium sp. PASSN1 TaxID=2015561 RepID=UPI0025DCF73F|nr:FAD-dependent oxidoreductase [Novosphingobium sp. PASSN1]